MLLALRLGNPVPCMRQLRSAGTPTSFQSEIPAIAVDMMRPDVVMVCAGDIPTLETLAAVDLLRQNLPDLKVRVVNVVDLMKLQPETEHSHGLPPALMDAFRATLEEVTEADALLHLVDLSHPAWADHIRSVEEILADLPSMPGTALLAFNKIDRVDSDTLAQAQQAYPNAIFISATERLGLDTLKQRLLQLIDVAPRSPQ